MAFTALFGDKLLGKSGEQSTNEVLAGKDVVFVYFSAHWCPPCRGFTPKFAEFYNKHAANKNFEAVFVSSDRDEDGFNGYYGDMPWYALPFSARDVKARLSKKYKVQGIPTLVILGPEGEVYSKDGTSKVTENLDDCAGFPWKPANFGEALGESFLKKDGSTVDKSAIAGKTLGLYFSAHWCPPCRGFTPVLKDFYTEYKAKDSNFEIIFLSRDRTEDAMLEYFKNDHGDYLALPYDKRKECDALNELFEVQGIPTFVVVDATGQVVNGNARGKVSAGVDAVVAKGWAPAAVGDMAQGVEAGGSDIESSPTLVVICDKSDAATQQAVQDALEPLAKRYIDEGKAKDEDPAFIFIVAKGGGPLDRLKELTKGGAGELMENAGSKPVMILFDIPDEGGYYVSDTHEITTASVEAFLANKGERKQLG